MIVSLTREPCEKSGEFEGDFNKSLYLCELILRNMKNVIVRSLTGIVYIALIVGAILAGKYAFAGLLLLFMLPSMYEFSRMHDDEVATRSTLFTDILIAETFIVCGLADAFNATLLACIGVTLIIVRLVMQLYIKNLNPLNSLGHSALSWAYIGLPLALLGHIYVNCPALVLGMFVMLWLNDTGAFCVGSLMGRHKLFERVSPKKSWEGFVGGLLFCTGAGVLYYYCFGSHFVIDGGQMALWQLIVMGLIVGITGTYGDLVESVFKRSCGIKDSGHILPGHGGMLDRIDSMLLAAPSLAIYLTLIAL